MNAANMPENVKKDKITGVQSANPAERIALRNPAILTTSRFPHDSQQEQHAKSPVMFA